MGYLEANLMIYLIGQGIFVWLASALMNYKATFMTGGCISFFYFIGVYSILVVVIMGLVEIYWCETIRLKKSLKMLVVSIQ